MSAGAVSARNAQAVVVLARVTVAWNVVEAIVALAAGAAANSIALVGFGLDSTVEVVSALVILWQFHGLAHEREQRALHLIAISFFTLAAYTAGQAVLDLATAARPEASRVGIGLAAASLIVMPVLAIAKQRVGRALHSPTVIADSNQTRLCAYLSAVLLCGLALNAALDWWWADPVAALAIAGLAVNEGRDAWRGDPCCD